MSGRWAVRLGLVFWRAIDPDCDGGANCRCRQFSTWRRTFDYADRMARADR